MGLCSLSRSWELLLMLWRVCMMLRLLPRSWKTFTSLFMVSWTGPAGKGGGGEVLVDGSSWEGGRCHRRAQYFQICRNLIFGADRELTK